MRRLVTLVLAFTASGAAADVATFNFSERFGVSYRSQLLSWPHDTTYNPRTHKMRGPNGQEVAWAQAADESIMVQTRIPRSLRAYYLKQGGAAGGGIIATCGGLTGSNCVDAGMLRAGSAVVWDKVGESSPGGITHGLTYYVVSYNTTTTVMVVSESKTLTPAVTFSSGGGSSILATQGAIIDPDDADAFYAKAHEYEVNDPVVFQGGVPSGIEAGTTYYVRDVTADTFKVAATVGGSAISPGSAGSGVLEVITDWTWTLEDSSPPAATPTNPVVVDRTNPDYIQVTNGLLGIRVPSNALNATPATSWKRSDSTLASCVVSANVATCTTSTDHGLTAGVSKVTISGVWTTDQDLNGEYTVASTPTSTTFTVSTSSVANGTYNESSMIVLGGVAPYRGPIYGFRIGSGDWVDTSAQRLYSHAKGQHGPSGGFDWQNITTSYPAFLPLSYRVYFSELSALRAVLLLEWTTNRPPCAGCGWSGGIGSYALKITVNANTKAVTFERETDTILWWHLNTYGAFASAPDVLRWYGNPSPTLPACNYLPVAIDSMSLSGTTLTVNTVGAHSIGSFKKVIVTAPGSGDITGLPIVGDATVSDSDTITITCSGCAGSTGSGGTLKTIPYTSGGIWRSSQENWVDVDYASEKSPAYNGCAGTTSVTQYKFGVNTWGFGKYYFAQWYNAAAADSEPLVGLFGGDPARDLAPGSSYPGTYSDNVDPASGAEGIGFVDKPQLRGADNSYVTTTTRTSYGLFLGTKADLATGTGATSEINRTRNETTGINLSHLASYTLTYDDPAGGWTYQFLDDDYAEDLISNIQDGTTLCGSADCLYTKLCNSDSGDLNRVLLGVWKRNTAGYAAYALSFGMQAASQLLNVSTNRDGTSAAASSLMGYEGLYPGVRWGPAMNAVIQSGLLSATQKADAKAVLAVYGSLAWDNTFLPLDGTGIGTGTANQTRQSHEYRAMFAAHLTEHPLMARKWPEALAGMIIRVNFDVNAYGSGNASTHYQSTYTIPSELNLLSANKTGKLSIADYPQIAQHGLFACSCLTPPEPRFGALRKMYSNGDGNTAAQAWPGVVATSASLFDETNGAYTAWCYNAMNNASTYLLDGFFVPSVAATNLFLASTEPSLTSTHFPGYHTGFRSNWGGDNESAIWFRTGTKYADHGHYDDGNVIVYAHKAPLSIDFNANLYSPQTSGSYWHNVVTLASQIGQEWDADNPPITAGNGFFANGWPGYVTHNEVAMFARSGMSARTIGNTTTWKREVQFAHGNIEYPIIRVKDTFGGSGATDAKVLTWNFMSTGAITKPDASTETPTTRSNTGNNGVLPSSGTPFSITANVLNKFEYTGQTWTEHATNGIDWHLYLRPSASTNCLLGHWSHDQHSAREKTEYNTVNGTTFRESQQITRCNSTGSFESIILPWRKGEAPTQTVSAESCGVRIVRGTETECVSDTEYTYTDGTAQVLTSYDDQSHTAYSMTLNGGTQEIVKNGSAITWKISGHEAGVRSFTPPSGTWYADKAVMVNGSAFEIYHPGGEQPETYTVTFTQTPSARRSVGLEFTPPAGATAARVRLGSEYVGWATCSGVCRMTLQAGPAAGGPMRLEYLSESGVVLGASQPIPLDE